MSTRTVKSKMSLLDRRRSAVGPLMDNFMQILGGAPWWVWVLLLILGRIGIKALKPRTVSIQRMVLFPLFFIAWSIYSLYGNVMQGSSHLVVWWVISIVVGAWLGFKEVQSWHFHVDRKKGLITIPGNQSTLILILLIFVLKFFWGYYYSTLYEVPYSIYLADTCSSAVVTGFFLGRAIFFCKRYQKG